MYSIQLAKRDPDSIQMPPPFYDPMRTFRFAVFGAAMGTFICVLHKYILIISTTRTRDWEMVQIS